LRMGEVSTMRMGEVSTMRIGEVSTMRMGEVSTMRLGEVSTMRLGEVASKRLGEVASMRLGELATMRMGEASLLVKAARTLPWCCITSKISRMERIRMTVMILPRHGLARCELPLLELPVTNARIVSQRWSTLRIFVFFFTVPYGVDGFLDF
jgi:hypothetical protein